MLKKETGINHSIHELLPSTYDDEYKLEMIEIAENIIGELDEVIVKHVTIKIIEDIWKSEGKIIPQMIIDIKGHKKNNFLAIKCSEAKRQKISIIAELLHGEIE